MNGLYKAHINEKTAAVQTIKEHSENTARLCAQFAVPPLGDLMCAMGMLHDIGKYQPSFQKRIDGASVQVEHSICGALEAKNSIRMFSGCLWNTALPDITAEFRMAARTMTRRISLLCAGD